MINKSISSIKKDGLSLYELVRLALGLPVSFFSTLTCLTYINKTYESWGRRPIRGSLTREGNHVTY
ncbi:hypothetical protein ACFL28_01780 [Candidatus Omnitrophota bacterium]